MRRHRLSPPEAPDDSASFRFTPAERATGRARLFWLGLGLLIWPIAIAILVWVVATDDMIQYALLITGGVFLLALAFLGWGAWLTSRRDRAGTLEQRRGRP